MKDKDLTNREKLIMKCVWAAGQEISLQELQRELKERFQWDANRSTVRTFLSSMQGKEAVTVERRGRFSYIAPLYNEEKYKKAQLKKLMDFWFNGSKEDLIKALTEGN